MTLEELLVLLIGGGGSGIAATFLLEQLKKLAGFGAWWGKLAEETKTILAYTISSIIVAIAYGLQIVFGYALAPETTVGVIEALFAIIVSQIIYGRVRGIRKKREALLYG